MSVTPGPWAMPSSMRNGRSAAVPGSNTVSMWPMSRTRGPPALPSNVADDRVAEAALGIRPDLDLGARARRGSRAVQRPTSSTPVGRVAAAVDVDQALEVGEVGRQVGGDRRRAARRARRLGRTVVAGRHRRAESTRRPACYPAGTVRLVEIRLLEGPNVYRLEPVVKVEVAIGRRRTWYGQRDPGRHALVHLGADGPGPRLARPIAAIVAWIRRLRADHGEGRGGARRPPLVRPRALDRHLPVDRRGARRDPPEAALALAERDVSPSRDRPADRRPGAAARALDRADRRAPATTPPSWIRDADRRDARSSRSRAPTARAPSPG